MLCQISFLFWLTALGNLKQQGLWVDWHRTTAVSLRLRAGVWIQTHFVRTYMSVYEKKKPCSFSLTGLMPVSHSPIWLLEVLLHTSCLSKEKRKHWMKAASSVNLALVHTCQFLHCLLAVCTPVGFKSLKHYLAQTTYQHMPIQGSIYMKLHIGWQFSFKLCLLNLQS